MNTSFSLNKVLRRTFGIYAEQAPVLLVAAIVVDGVVALDRMRFSSSPPLAIGEALVDFVVIGLFVCVVVLVVADVWDGGPRRNTRELLRGAWFSLGPLLLVGVVAAIAIALLASLWPFVFFVVIASVAVSAGIGILGLIIGLLLVPVLMLVPELYLFTTWSVLAAVSVLERPGVWHTFRRSRELVGGNAWQVLALILVLAFPLALAASEIERAASTAGSGPATAVRLLAGVLITPIPVLAATVLYFELRHTQPTPATADPTPPGVLPSGVSLS